MEMKRQLIPDRGQVSIVTADNEPDATDTRTFATRDHEVIKRWALRRQATPATGEASASGPATIDVKDGGSALRFSFPGMGQFRPIDWEEWFEHFDTHELAFVYEESTTNRNQSSRYRILRAEDLNERATAQPL